MGVRWSARFGPISTPRAPITLRKLSRNVRWSLNGADAWKLWAIRKITLGLSFCENSRLRAQPQWNRILVTRMSAMGDIIHSLPAVAALRQAFPSALIGWVIEDRWADLISAPSASAEGRSPAQPLADVVHRVNTRAWRSSPLSAATRKEIKTVIGELKKIGYDVVIDLQAAIRSAVLGRLSGARTRIRFAKP